ncbi:EpsI family protein, partial [Klebsiella pneumoniae]|nr:EpsI family protein [Klebsiella pneumoniae]
GAGWRPISSTTIDLPTARGPAPVNQYVIQKGRDQQVVLYWYQGRGRVVANEYRNKLLMMWDAATLHRTNGGLVRVMSPVRPGADAATDVAAF